MVAPATRRQAFEGDTLASSQIIVSLVAENETRVVGAAIAHYFSRSKVRTLELRFPGSRPLGCSGTCIVSVSPSNLKIRTCS